MDTKKQSSSLKIPLIIFIILGFILFALRVLSLGLSLLSSESDLEVATGWVLLASLVAIVVWLGIKYGRGLLRLLPLVLIMVSARMLDHC